MKKRKSKIDVPIVDIPMGQAVLLIPGQPEEIEALFNAMGVLHASVEVHCDEPGRAAFLALAEMMQRARVVETPKREFDA
ncbi:hypothetical protein [Roseinatronobacter sp. NSM]|uniref:hypothetical protein n=1 Tax=Roseinatronobacter sp. NSM TaxID=3457785 RepID=UPI004035F043